MVRTEGGQMTNEEAIRVLKNAAWFGSDKDRERTEDAVGRAVEALKKQIPMHPVQSKEPRSGMGYDYYDWACPTCGCFLAFEPAKIGPHHCICGQLINWGGNNDSE